MTIIRVKPSSIVNLFCLIGCSIQIYHITCTYLKFEVRNEVTYDYTDQVELPAIDIMIPMAMSINLTELFIRYPEQMTKLCQATESNNKFSYTIDNFNSNCSHRLQKDGLLPSYYLASFIKVRDINELTINPVEQISKIVVLNSYFISYKCKFTRYYSGFAIFLRIYCSKQGAQITDNINIIKPYGGNIAAIDHLLGSYFGIRFSSQSIMPVYESSKYFMVTRQSGKVSVAWIRYEKMISRSLPYPYKSNCRYYSKFKVLTNCIVNYTLSEKFLLRDIVYEWGSQSEYLSFHSSTLQSGYEYEYEYGNEYEYEKDRVEEEEEDEDAEKQQQLDRVIGDCVQKVLLPECQKTTYLIEGEINPEKSSIDSSSGAIFIQQPVTPIMYSNLYPNLLLSEYLIFIGSIIGIWFGYSIFDRLIITLTWIGIKVLTKIKENRKSKRPIKIFIVRNSYYHLDPLRHSTSYSSIDVRKK